jgi:hypothetical protein
VQLLISAFAISVAALTLVLAARRILTVVGHLVVSRWFWIGGVIGFTAVASEATGNVASAATGNVNATEPTGGVAEPNEYRVRFEVGGPGAFHNVSIHVLGLTESDDGRKPVLPARRTTMNAGDDPIDWTFTIPPGESASNAWLVVTWVRPYLESVESEAIARWLDRDELYEWLWYGDANRLARIGIRTWARRHPRRSTQKMRDLAVFGRWRISALSGAIDMQGPVEVALPE